MKEKEDEKDLVETLERQSRRLEELSLLRSKALEEFPDLGIKINHSQLHPIDGGCPQSFSESELIVKARVDQWDQEIRELQRSIQQINAELKIRKIRQLGEQTIASPSTAAAVTHNPGAKESLTGRNPRRAGRRRDGMVKKRAQICVEFFKKGKGMADRNSAIRALRNNYLIRSELFETLDRENVALPNSENYRQYSSWVELLEPDSPDDLSLINLLEKQMRRTWD